MNNMKKTYLILGILLLLLGILALAWGGLSWYGYKHVLDGSAQLYERLRTQAFRWFSGGTALFLLGAASVILYCIRKHR